VEERKKRGGGGRPFEAATLPHQYSFSTHQVQATAGRRKGRGKKKLEEKKRDNLEVSHAARAADRLGSTSRRCSAREEKKRGTGSEKGKGKKKGPVTTAQPDPEPGHPVITWTAREGQGQKEGGEKEKEEGTSEEKGEKKKEKRTPPACRGSTPRRSVCFLLITTALVR